MRYYLLIYFFLFIPLLVVSQSQADLARSEYYVAEEAFNQSEFEECIKHLDKSEEYAGNNYLLEHLRVKANIKKENYVGAKEASSSFFSIIPDELKISAQYREMVSLLASINSGLETTLCEALQKEDLNKVKYLINDLGVDFRTTDCESNFTRSAIFHAMVFNESEEITLLLINKWHQLNQQELIDYFSSHKLVKVIDNGWSKSLEALLKYGLNPNIIIDDFTPLFYALSGGEKNHTIVQTIISANGTDNFIIGNIKTGKEGNSMRVVSYLLATNKKLDLALNLINKYIDRNNNYFWLLYQKAEILVALGDIATARQTILDGLRVAKNSKNGDYGYIERFNQLLNEINR